MYGAHSDADSTNVTHLGKERGHHEVRFRSFHVQDKVPVNHGLQESNFVHVCSEFHCHTQRGFHSQIMSQSQLEST